MKKFLTHLPHVFIALNILGIIVLSIAYAQEGDGGTGHGGWATDQQFSRMYNPDTIVTISGKVIGTDEIAPLKGMSNGIHLTLETEIDRISVHLGPVWFVNAMENKIQVGDAIEVIGSQIDFEGEPAVIASEIRKNDLILKFRDSNGIPLWHGKNRK